MPRLLFDENLSHHLPARLEPVFPESAHVRDLQLRGAADIEIWSRAAREGFVIVTKDDDFAKLSFMHGAPPKVVRLVVGNSGTERIIELLTRSQSTIASFVDDQHEALLVLRLAARDP